MTALRSYADVRRLAALLDSLAVRRDDLLERIDRAQALQERGALFAIEQDDLIDAVRAWRLAAADVVLGGCPHCGCSVIRSAIYADLCEPYLPQRREGGGS